MNYWLLAQTAPSILADYGPSAAIVVVVISFLAYQKYALVQFKILADSCHNAHQEDLKRVESITQNLNGAVGKLREAVGQLK